MRILAAMLLAVLALAGCKAPDDSDPNIATPPAAGASSAPAPAPGQTSKAAKPQSDTRVITYRVGGSASAGSITYMTPSGQEQQNGVSLPWKRSMKVKRGSFAMLAVTVQNSGSGTITCEIDIDGQKVKAAKSSGAYALVSCDHTLGL